MVIGEEHMLIKRAQSLGEYSICLAVVLIALVTMNVYVKRGLQGRYKDVVDATTSAVAAPQQYEPYYVDSATNIETPRGMQITGTMEGKITRQFLPDVGPTTVDKAEIERASEEIDRDGWLSW